MPLIEELVGQNTHDPHMYVYHTRCELADGREEGVRGDVSSLGEFGQLFLSIKGVVKVCVFPYVLSIYKAELFSWDEITPKAQDILGMLIKSQRGLLALSEGIHEAGPDVGDQRLTESPATV